MDGLRWSLVADRKIPFAGGDGAMNHSAVSKLTAAKINLMNSLISVCASVPGIPPDSSHQVITASPDTIPSQIVAHATPSSSVKNSGISKPGLSLQSGAVAKFQTSTSTHSDEVISMAPGFQLALSTVPTQETANSVPSDVEAQLTQAVSFNTSTRVILPDPVTIAIPTMSTTNSGIFASVVKPVRWRLKRCRTCDFNRHPGTAGLSQL